MLKGPLASLERHDRPAFEGRSGSERSTEPGSSAKTVASQPVVGYRIRSRTAKKEILAYNTIVTLINAVRTLQGGSVVSFCKKNRTCCDCGFLTIRERELVRTERAMLSSADGRNMSDVLYTDEMCCYRDQWTAKDVERFIEDGNLDRELHADRRDCRYFFQYEPNFTRYAMPPPRQATVIARTMGYRSKPPPLSKSAFCS